MAVTWTLVGNNLPACRAQGMCWDAANNVVLFPFGGPSIVPTGDPRFLSTAYVWDGSLWSPITPANFPAATNGQTNARQFTYDEANGNVVLFSGGDPSSYPTNWQETWTWDGSDWTQLAPATQPSARDLSNMAWCPNQNRVVLFGGRLGAGGFYNDETWTWDGTIWTQESPGTVPGARYYGPMAADRNGNVVMFGGLGTGNVDLNDTWVWDGTDWTEMFPATPPVAGNFTPLAYDPNTQFTYLFYGANSTVGHNDTWVWDGSEWTQLFPIANPGARYSPAFAYDGNLGQPLLSTGGLGGSASALSNSYTLGPVAEGAAINNLFGLGE